MGFKLYDDSSLITVSGTTLTLTCENDLSDGAHDETYYFGSIDVSKQLQAVSNPGVDNITLTPTYIIPARAALTAYALGDSVIPASANGYRYECTTAGTSSAGTPTWGTTINGTTTDGSVTWTLVAAVSPVTEVILALTSGELSTNTPGASLALGNTILSGVAEAVPIYMRVTNTITTVSDSLGTPEFGININLVQQESV